MRNVEIKAKLSNFSEFFKKASEISDCSETVLIQTDTYFKAFNGRLKLRQIERKNHANLHEVNKGLSCVTTHFLHSNRDVMNVNFKPNIEDSENGIAMLIFYNRSDIEGPKLSDYSMQTFQSREEAEGLKVLECSLGIVGVVKKRRSLFMVKQTRIHVDDVKGLGHFMELEVVLNDDETVEDGQQVADELMSRLGVLSTDLISGSYIDMLNKNK